MDSFAPATLAWDESGRPAAPLYGDIYGSRQGALAQAEHVFLGGNRLAEHFAALAPGGSFTVGETGFGTGLNFLAAQALFGRAAPAGARLHFVSVEKHPMTAADARRALADFPDPGAMEALLAQWPPPLPGTHRLAFALAGGQSASLTLLYGEAVEVLDAADAGRGVEAWFFDGFSPQKNPAMWSAELFTAAARLSAPGATFATWTVGEQVRMNLSAAGWSWQRQEGFGKKREMLAGKLTQPPPCAREPCVRRTKNFQTALVIGAGISGCAAARALAVRGVRVTLADWRGIGAHSSGNAQGLVQPMFSGIGTLEGDFSRAAFWHAVRQLAVLAPDLWHPTGSLWWREPKNLEVFRRRVKKLGWPESLMREVTAQEAGAIAGIVIPSAAVHCPVSGWVSPARLCARLTQHPLITFEKREVAKISGDEADWVVIAAAECAPALVASLGPAAALPQLRLIPVRGQNLSLPAVPASTGLKCVLHFGHYLVPAEEGRHTLGATHQSGDLDLACRSEDEAELLAGADGALPALAGVWKDSPRTTRAGLRCHVADRLPVVGCLPSHPHVALLTALGPRGISMALLGAELLAAEMFGEPLPVPKAWADAVGVGRLKK